jgi:uncharacterized protein (TIGR02301 family)
MNWAVPALMALALAPRSPDQRQAVVDLAYVLGEAHALRLVCVGPDAQTWRTRMSRLLDLEAGDEATRRRLVDRFNAGFMSRQAEHPACTPATAAAERATAARGRALAQRLAGPAP